MALGMTQRFSTKYYDGEYTWDYSSFTEGYRFELRLYSPPLARFISQDPIAERGGPNLYGFCANDPINKWDYLGMKTINVPKCHAILIIGHGNKKDPLRWEFPEDTCAYGGAAMCWPSENNPGDESQWPNVPIHDWVIFSGGWLRDLFVGQSNQKPTYDTNYRAEDWETDFSKIINDIWSKSALGTIKDKLCGSKCCCKEITFEIHVFQGGDEIKKPIKKFNWQVNSVRRIKFPCKKR